MDKLAVSEMFLSLQGEGQTMGRPSFFIRLSGCNLTCGVTRETLRQAKRGNWSQNLIDDQKKEEATWVCDSISVWMKGKQISFQDIIDELNEKYEFINRLKDGTHLIITGGEPLLQQNAIEKFIKYIKREYKVTATIEIETNGTITPSSNLNKLVDYWNVSPKLTNSGMSYSSRCNEAAIKSHNSNPNSIFKFVIENENDWLEIMNEWMGGLNVDPHKVWLMPAASNIGELMEHNKTVAEIAIKYNVNCSTRLQVEFWNQTVGV